MALLKPSTSIDELATTTLRNRTGALADNVSKNNALLARLKKRGNVKTFDGGRTIVQEIFFAENGNFGFYSGYEQLSMSPQEVMTSAEYNIAQAAVGVSISGLEMLQNSGEEAIIDLLESRIENAESTLMNNIATSLYSDGTGWGGRQIGGLALLVSTTPNTGTVGNIDASTTVGSFWRNKAFSAVTDGGAPASSANIQSYMNRLALQLVRGNDRADLYVADNNYYRLYLESLQAIQRVTSEEMTGAGFTALKYYGAGNEADIVLDGGIGGGAPANRMYMLNTKYIFFRPHKDRNFVPFGGDRTPINQDALVKYMGFAGNMTTSGRMFQGVLAA